LVGRPPESATDSDIPRDVRDVGHHEQTSQRWDLAKEVNTPATIAIQPISRLKPRSMSRPKQVKDTLTSTNPAVLKVQLVETGSPDRVTIAAIVKEAGCTPPSLYHYWSTRDLLLKEASASGWAQFRVSQTDAVADDLSPASSSSNPLLPARVNPRPRPAAPWATWSPMSPRPWRPENSVSPIH
jgi:hypothetical protein